MTTTQTSTATLTLHGREVTARGSLDLLTIPGRVAITGSRASTPYGENIANSTAQMLAGRGVVTIASTAYGIDSAAVRGALTADLGRIILVQPAGIDQTYPRGTAELAPAVEAHGGLILSMHTDPQGTPSPLRLPRRRRSARRARAPRHRRRGRRPIHRPPHGQDLLFALGSSRSHHQRRQPPAPPTPSGRSLGLDRRSSRRRQDRRFHQRVPPLSRGVSGAAQPPRLHPSLLTHEGGARPTGRTPPSPPATPRPQVRLRPPRRCSLSPRPTRAARTGRRR